VVVIVPVQPTMILDVIAAHVGGKGIVIETEIFQLVWVVVPPVETTVVVTTVDVVATTVLPTPTIFAITSFIVGIRIPTIAPSMLLLLFHLWLPILAHCYWFMNWLVLRAYNTICWDWITWSRW
jgi:hypothetical protein